MKKKICQIALGLICMFSLFLGIGKAAEAKRVAYIARAQGDSFAAWLANAIVDEAKKYPNISVKVMDGQADDDKISGFIENCITNKYDLIILQPNNGEAQRPYIEKVVKAGIPIILTNPRVKDIAGTNSVDADPYEQAAVCARLALKQVPQNAKVVVLNGPAGNMHAIARRESWKKEFFDKRPDVKIVGEQIANWNKEEAMRYMEDWVQANDKIDAIISMNDNMCAGALEVVKDNPKYAHVLAYGVDGTAEAALLIKDGKMTATCFQNAYALAEQNMKMANDILTGAVKGPQNVDINCPLYTKDNVDELIAVHKKAGALK